MATLLEESEPLYLRARSEDDASSGEESARPPQFRSSWHKRWTAYALLASAALNAVMVGLLMAQISRRESLDHTCDQNELLWESPILKDIKVPHNRVFFNNSLKTDSIYRSDPSPEVDAAWKALGIYYRAVRIPADEAEKYGLKGHLQYAEEWGGGYPATIEGLHQLNCLNLLRKTLAWNFDYYEHLGVWEFGNTPESLKFHTKNCLENLRLNLMCKPNTEVFGHVWVMTDGNRNLYPDFMTEHKCKDFETIRRWAELHQVPWEAQMEYHEGDLVFDGMP